ncbi:MAG: hypothetical protein ACJA2M_002186 [Polaribacter sp.]|jgi:hypothetical protein
MAKPYKILVGFIIISVSLILFYFIGWSFAPGSYPRAETYEFDLTETELISIIQEFKEENPKYKLTQEVDISEGNSFYLKEGRSDSLDHWYSIYFYYPNKNQIVKTWTRPQSKTKTTFAFVAINNSLTLGNWIDVNKSFLWWKNKPIKLEFEEKILNKIKVRVANS